MSVYDLFLWLFILAAAASIMDRHRIAEVLWSAWFVVIAIGMLYDAASLL